MAKLNIENTRKALQSFDFKTLFVEELGWSNPSTSKVINETIKDIAIVRKPIAELSGAVVFEITTPTGNVPEPKDRTAIAKEIQKQHYEHVLIFLDSDRKQSIWHWLKQHDKKLVSREHFYFRHQPGDGFIAKIASLVVDISEFDREGNIAIAEVASRIKSALDIERVVKKFFREYQQEYIVFLDLIDGIDNEADRRWYASVILNRLMFIYFLQKKLFVDNANANYLNNKLEFSKNKLGENKFYEVFLSKLFFEGFAKSESQRSIETNKLIGNIKYLNGGLFLKHKIEIKYDGKIKISDVAFMNLFNLFDRYSWTLNDTPGGADNEMNPDVLGYIFEKYINQKAFGAYYTRTEITEYLCEQTVYKLILDAINEPEGLEQFMEKVPESMRKGVILKPKRYDSIAELLLNLDAANCKKLVMGDEAILPNLSLLDPACGSGAFLVAAMKTLINVYAAVLGKIDFLGDKKLTVWKQQIESDHPSINYYIKKQIITNNLYGVDLMEEATEIAKLRLFLALVASADTVDQLEPLPNIDFNIMNGNSLIGLMRVDAGSFEKHQGQNLFRKSYPDLLREKNIAIQLYKNPKRIDDIQLLKNNIERHREEALPILDDMLMDEFGNQGIKYEQITWDEKKNKEGKAVKRSLNIQDIKALEPFHWGYEFSEIFRKKDGFDAIITNPPWEVFKPNSKEFFLDYSNVVSKKKMNIKDFEKEQEKILEDLEIREAWTNYLSRFPYVSSYFRRAKQFENQISIVNGKKAGSDINLYKLFTEQCFNLLRKGGYSGIVIPSGIYSDLGTKQIREMLFSNTKITGLFCFENRKEIFEGVHRSFKFVVLSFEKGGKTKSFPASFMRYDVEELANFPQYGSSILNVEFIKRQSPDSYSIMEVKNNFELTIGEKLLKFPMLSEEVKKSFAVKLAREFDMTTGENKKFVSERPEKENEILFEGKMIWQFQNNYCPPKFWVKSKEIRQLLLGKNSKQLSSDYYRIVFRRQSASTNERTFVSTIIQPCIHADNLASVQVIDENEERLIEYSDELYLVSFFNSYCLDYYLRTTVNNNLNFFYIYQLPLPRLNPIDLWYQAIVERAAKLICTTEEFAELWEEVMKTKWSEKLATTNEYERNKLRAELDGIIAHIYGLSEEEFTYILSTFPIVPQPQKVATQNAYRDVINGLIKPE
jgi:hypothetical protein